MIILENSEALIGSENYTLAEARRRGDNLKIMVMRLAAIDDCPDFAKATSDGQCKFVGKVQFSVNSVSSVVESSSELVHRRLRE